jgi:hypothetical protein
MNSINKQITERLDKYISYKDFEFEFILNSIDSDHKEEFLSLLNYLNNILNDSLQKRSETPNVLHIHFEDNFNDAIKTLIAKFLIIKSFYNYYKIDEKNNLDKNNIDKVINHLTINKQRLTIYPTSASKNNRVAKLRDQERKKNSKLLKFYTSIPKSSLTTKVLFNCQIKSERLLNSSFESKPFAISLEQHDVLRSYCILNSLRQLNELDKFENLIDELESVIIFDCERKRFITNISYDEINKWNKEYGTKFKEYVVVSFGKDEKCVENIKSKIQLIKERFKVLNDSTYTILSSEVNFLLNNDTSQNIPIIFCGPENPSLWETLKVETSIRELYELRSIKMLNLYSLVYDSDIKNYILDDLFSGSETSKFISSTTKQTILELRVEDRELIKECINNLLNLIIQLDLRSNIIKELKNNSIIIASDFLFKDTVLIAKVSKALSLSTENKLKTWDELGNINDKPVLILAYRDQGKFSYHFFPNIVESVFPAQAEITSILIRFLFQDQYEWANYNYNKDLHKYLTHPIRNQYFEWEQLKAQISHTKPRHQLSIDLALENEFSFYENRETIKLKFKNPKRSKTFLSSDLFIITNSEQTEYRVQKICDIQNYDLNDESLMVQNLDEIQEDINIYERIVDTKHQEMELKAIRENFDLNDEDAGRLWKVLLKNLSIKMGQSALYDELKAFFEQKELKIVSLNHFKNTWINPNSESLAPLNKRIFISLCEYLKIPKSYFIILQRIRNASKQASRQSTRQMNYLLKDLFNDGCFDDISKTRSILNNNLSKYKANHPLDELGIDEDNLLKNLVTLVELIHPELKLIEVESIERLIYE